MMLSHPNLKEVIMPVTATPTFPKLEANGSRFRYRYQWRDGAKVRSKTFGSYATAKEGKRDEPYARSRFKLWARQWDERPSVRSPVGVYTVAAMMNDYLAHAERRYVKNGKPTTTVNRASRARDLIVELHGSLPADQLDAPKLAAWRDSLKPGRVSDTVNKMLDEVGKAASLAREGARISAAVLADIQCVTRVSKHDPMLGEGRGSPETTRRAVFHAMRHLIAPVAAMVYLQWQTGMRPGEVRVMRGMDLDTSREDVWLYTVPNHKTTHHGKERIVALPLRATVVVRAWLRNNVAEPLFGTRHNCRNNVSGGWRAYDRSAYRTAIIRACDRAGVEPFTPNAIRHAYADRVRAAVIREGGNREDAENAVKAVLGNSRRVAAGYGKDVEAAVEAARKVG